MKIGNTTSTVAKTAIDGDRRTVTQDSSSTSVTTLGQEGEASSTQVELSPEASLLADIGNDPSFDSEKVERIAQAIRDGRFQVNPGVIADKLISNSQELLARSSTAH